MITDKEFKRLCDIDDKMLNNMPITEEERKERTNIVLKFKHEIDRAYLKDAKII